MSGLDRPVGGGAGPRPLPWGADGDFNDAWWGVAVTPATNRPPVAGAAAGTGAATAQFYGTPAVGPGGVGKLAAFEVFGTAPTQPSTTAGVPDFKASNAGKLSVVVQLRQTPGGPRVNGKQSDGFSVTNVPLAVDTTAVVTLDSFTALGTKYTIGLIYDFTDR